MTWPVQGVQPSASFDVGRAVLSCASARLLRILNLPPVGPAFRGHLPQEPPSPLQPGVLPGPGCPASLASELRRPSAVPAPLAAHLLRDTALLRPHVPVFPTSDAAAAAASVGSTTSSVAQAAAAFPRWYGEGQDMLLIAER